MLNALPDVDCTELRLFGNSEMAAFDQHGRSDFRLTADRYAYKLAQHMSKPRGLTDQEALRVELTQELVMMLLNFVKSRTNAKVIVDKVTPYMGSEKDTYNAYRRSFPQAKIFFLMRDCRDVAVSGMYHWHERITSEQGPSDFEISRLRTISEKRTTSSLDTAFRTGELESWVNAWVAMSQLEREFSDCTIRYENLLLTPEPELARLIDFLGIPISKENILQCIENTRFEIMSGGRSPGDSIPNAHIRKGVAGDWTRYLTRKDGQVLQDLAGDEIKSQGYARNADWISTLHEYFAFREGL